MPDPTPDALAPVLARHPLPWTWDAEAEMLTDAAGVSILWFTPNHAELHHDLAAFIVAAVNGYEPRVLGAVRMCLSLERSSR